MEQVQKFINHAQVEANGDTKVAKTKIYVTKASPIEICQKVSYGDYYEESIFSIRITNNSNQDIRHLELIDRIYSNDPFIISCIQMEYGYYQLSPKYIYFYIPLLKKKEELLINLLIYSDPRSRITNCAKVNTYQNHEPRRKDNSNPKSTHKHKDHSNSKSNRKDKDKHKLTTKDS